MASSNKHTNPNNEESIQKASDITAIELKEKGDTTSITINKRPIAKSEDVI